MRLKVLNILILLFAVAIATANADNTDAEPRKSNRVITGVVIDETGEPLPGVAISIDGTTVGAATDAHGEFKIKLYGKKGVAKLNARFMGYEPYEVEINDIPVLSLNITMSPSQNQLNEIIVTGSRSERELKDAPVVTRIISQKDIQQINPVDLSTLLQYKLPGLQITYNSMSQEPQITYQGMGGEYVVFLIDGERMSGEGADHNIDFNRLNISDIERIEVVRGAASTLYDSNALGGVINIITKSAKRPLSGDINVRYAGSNGENYSFSVGAKVNRFSSYSTVGYRHRSTYSIKDDNPQIETTVTPDGEVVKNENIDYGTTIYGYRIWDVSQKFGYSFTDKLSADLKGSFYRNRRDAKVGNKYYDLYKDYTVSGKVKYVFNENHTLDVTYIYDWYDKDKEFFSLPARNDYRNRNQTARINYTGQIGNHSLSIGAEWKQEYLKHYMLADSGSVSRDSYSLYLQEEWNITPSINIVAGIRGDYEQLYDFNLTPKLSVMYKPVSLLTIRAGYSQGYRSPSLKELYMEYDMGGLGWFTIKGNSNLKPEKSRQYTLSAETNFSGLNISLSAYHNRFKDKIAYNNDYMYINAENAKTTGIEAILRWNMPFGLSLSGSYAYVDDYEEVNGKNISIVRPHSMTFSAMYNRKIGKIEGNVSLNGLWASSIDTYTFDSDGTFSYVNYKARTICSLNIGAKIPRGIRLGFMIDNIFNFKDKSSDRSAQLPQKGISCVGTLSIDLAEMFKL